MPGLAIIEVLTAKENKQFDLAIVGFTKLINEDPDSKKKENLIYLLKHRAECFYYIREYNSAHADFKLAIDAGFVIQDNENQFVMWQHCQLHVQLEQVIDALSSQMKFNYSKIIKSLVSIKLEKIFQKKDSIRDRGRSESRDRAPKKN